MSTRLLDKVAIITGAGSGMGKSIAIAYANEGAKVVLADVNATTLDEVVTEITASGHSATSVVADMSKSADIKALIETAVNTYGQLDILVNNAGIMDNFKTVGNVTDDLWDKVIAINLTGPFQACREAINVMKDQKNGGIIINNASVGGLYGARGGAAYAASKHGLVGLTKNIAATYGTFGNIRCNAIAPGGVATNIGNTITDPDPLGGQAIAAAGSMDAPMGQPEQIAAVAVFLASDESSFVNGDIIKADGGWTAR
ncbi:SDR family oxidoreductase [Secundilactobacillus similis]|uniref:Short-chain dehydrogenase reductase SDR n=1 Tax=Secundilactobacillus similis DSM 23365 = JCM 2765 TaxID=1423804 RepID=A0A0R2FCL0_9LACO|nr:SDR family oxidoreductase [Secundilactobacillus similis]KRN26274.1 short-chain dehydrogenase reductase SDR [Secundilactobacillus similis DSM 23365 = JCM 2765]